MLLVAINYKFASSYTHVILCQRSTTLMLGHATSPQASLGS